MQNAYHYTPFRRFYFDETMDGYGLMDAIRLGTSVSLSVHDVLTSCLDSKSLFHKMRLFTVH